MQSLEQTVVAGARKRLIRGIVFSTLLMGSILVREIFTDADPSSMNVTAAVLFTSVVSMLGMYFGFKKELLKAVKDQQ